MLLETAISPTNIRHKLSRKDQIRSYSSSGISSASASIEDIGTDDDSNVPRKKIVYCNAKEEHKLELVSLLCKSFVSREPIGLGVGVTEADFMTWAPRIVDELTEQGVSLYFFNQYDKLGSTNVLVET